MAKLDRRLILDEKIRRILGSTNVYFEPPASLVMKYPCVRYRLARTDIRFASNKPYLGKNRYEVILIYEDADDDLPERFIFNEEGILFNQERCYTADNLHHVVLITYF